MTEEDRNLLESRRLKNNPDHNLDNAHHVFFRNEDADKLNQEKLNALDTELVEIKANLIHPKGYAPSITKHGTIDDTQFMKTLKVKVRAKVMLVYNINTSDSLVNGALGQILDIIKIENSSEVKQIIIEFKGSDIGEDQRKQFENICAKYSDQNGVPICRTTFEYSPHGRRSQNSHGVKCKIIQFAIRLAFGSTTHKLQGAEFKDEDLVCHGYHKLQKGMAYVMFSRCTNVENVFIDDDFDLKKVVCDLGCLEEKISLDDRSIVGKFQALTFDI